MSFTGSVARCEAKKDSDIDLIIVVEGLPRSRLKRLELFEHAEAHALKLLERLWRKGFAADFSPIMLTPEEASRHRPLYLDLIVDGIILYDKDGFMESVLNGFSAKLRELGARRVRLGKRW